LQLFAAAGGEFLIDCAALYRESRERIGALVRDVSEEQRACRVPACPEWTINDTLAHLAANAADELAATLRAVPDDEQTAAQVQRRRGRPLEEILADWDSAAKQIEPRIAAHPLAIAWVNDVLAHEADIRGAVGAGRPPEPAWTAALELARPLLVKKLGHLGELTILDGKHRITVGSGNPATTIEVDTYEFWRAALGRRSRTQMAGWKWSGDPEPYLQAIPRFGPTEVDLAEPVIPGQGR
jgi:uncharacterized protein (TIGR03083 family)